MILCMDGAKMDGAGAVFKKKRKVNFSDHLYH